MEHKSSIDPDTEFRFQMLERYAKKDAMRTGLSLPSPSEIISLADFMSIAGDVIFGPGDPNLDNQKRNIAIHQRNGFFLPKLAS